ncbi:MAG: PhnD/SsuA/transferrin family substrate-binding protein [Pseudomonadota bacterium]|nr:PhnD/SsuA/transferrin family substrate-binding protein [Pseudomonadota bacterium]
MIFAAFSRPSALAKPLLLAAALLSPLAMANERFVLGISESAAADANRLNAQVRYRAFADLLAQATKTPVFVQERSKLSDIEAGVRNGEFDFVLVRPADIAARAMREHNYRYVASGKPEARCLVGVTKDSPIQQLADVQGKRIATLDNARAYIVRFCAADLRDNGIDLSKQKLHTVKLQGAVGVSVASGLADVGLFTIQDGSAWEKQGNRIIHTSVPQPYFPLVASPRVSNEQIEAVRRALQAPANAATLKALGMDGVDIGQEQQLQTRLLPWLQGQAKPSP